MKDLLLDSIMNNITKYYTYSDTKLKEIRYGLESLYLSIVKVIVIFVLCTILKLHKELLLLFIFYGLLRLTAFGLHTKKSIHCWIASIITFVSIPFFIKYLYIPKNIIILLSSIFLLLIYKYAPADTEKRPIINPKKRKIYKYLSTIITLTYIIIIIISNNIYIQNLFFFSILTQTLLILPISYKLFGLKYNNYLYYKGKEDRK